MYFLTAERGSIHHSLRLAFNRFSEEHPLIWLANKRNERPEWSVTLLFWTEVSDDIAEESARIEREQRERIWQEQSADDEAPVQHISVSVRKTGRTVTRLQKATGWQRWQQWIEELFQ